MADPISLRLAAEEHGLGLRNGDDRRRGERRRNGRRTEGRRRRDRRRKRARTLLFAAVTLAAPFYLRSKPQPRVLVSTSGFTAIPADQAYEAFIQEAARLYELDAKLIRAVMRAESAFNPLVVSRAGAQGLMQLMPELAEEMGVTDPFDPRQNIMGGARYLRQLLDLHRGNVPLTLASYNAGPGAVARYRNRIPPFKETRQYVKKITEFLADEAGD